MPPYLGDTGSFPDVITAMDNWVAQKKGETKLDKFAIPGGHRLTVEIEVSGAKNAAVALIPAVLLSDEPCVLENVPDISDVSISLQIMSEMGATVEYLTKTTVRISAAGGPIIVCPMRVHEKCVHRIIFWVHCWDAMARREFPCPAAVRWATAPLTSI